MVEFWNDDFRRKFTIFRLHVNLNFPNKSLPHFSKTQYSIIPVFHYSNCERSELSSTFIIRCAR